MKLITYKPYRLVLAALFVLGLTNCSDDEIPDPIISNYYVGIESGTNPAIDVLSTAEDLTSGTISPVGNGFEQTAWTSFFQGPDQIFASGYTTAPEFTSYEIIDSVLTKGESFFTDLSIYALDIVNESTMVLMGSARSGLSDKKIYLINTNTMSIEQTVSVDFGNIPEDELLAFPIDLKVSGNKLFAVYYHTSSSGDFSTPKANTAYVAVFSYPELEFEKIISDDRAPNLGRYLSTNALEEDEKGDIYTYASSSLACGFSPVPSKNSAVLRIKDGETEFDADYYIDFEALSGGYKINDLLYVKDGKAVVRVVKEDESYATQLWATYAPNSGNPMIETGILDLYNEEFTLLQDVPKGGGGWNTAYLIEDEMLYLGISDDAMASIYVIDTKNKTASKGANIEGNYAKAVLALHD